MRQLQKGNKLICRRGQTKKRLQFQYLKRRHRWGQPQTRPTAARASGRPRPRAARGVPQPGSAGAAAARDRTHGAHLAAWRWRGGASSSAEVVCSRPLSCCTPLFRELHKHATAVSASARRRAPAASRRRRFSGTEKQRGPVSASRYLGFVSFSPRPQSPAKSPLILSLKSTQDRPI